MVAIGMWWGPETLRDGEQGCDGDDAIDRVSFGFQHLLFTKRFQISTASSPQFGTSDGEESPLSPDAHCSFQVWIRHPAANLRLSETQCPLQGGQPDSARDPGDDPTRIRSDRGPGRVRVIGGQKDGCGGWSEIFGERSFTAWSSGSMKRQKILLRKILSIKEQQIMEIDQVDSMLGSICMESNIILYPGRPERFETRGCVLANPDL